MTIATTFRPRCLREHIHVQIRHHHIALAAERWKGKEQKRAVHNKICFFRRIRSYKTKQTSKKYVVGNVLNNYCYYYFNGFFKVFELLVRRLFVVDCHILSDDCSTSWCVLYTIADKSYTSNTPNRRQRTARRWQRRSVTHRRPRCSYTCARGGPNISIVKNKKISIFNSRCICFGVLQNKTSMFHTDTIVVLRWEGS